MENIPQLVLESYIKYGIRPKTKILHPSGALDWKGCCGLGVLFYEEIEEFDNNEDRYNLIRKKLKASFAYGFMNGFDNSNSFHRCESDLEEMALFDKGKEDGRKARELVMKHFNLPEDF